MFTSRKITNKIYDAVAEGVLTWEQVAEGALRYMREDDVALMAHNEEFFVQKDEVEIVVNEEVKAFLETIGIEYRFGMEMPLLEEDLDGITVFVKFMSYGGNLDEVQADQFEAWLKQDDRRKHTRHSNRCFFVKEVFEDNGVDLVVAEKYAGN